MTLIRLARHRREASSRGVLPDSVPAQHPRPVKGTSRPIVEYRFKSSFSQGVDDVASSVAQDPQKTSTKVEIVMIGPVKTEATMIPVLHLRPRYIYGDVYAPVYQPSEREGVQTKLGERARSRTSVVDACEKRRTDAEYVDRPYVGLVPSVTGVNLAQRALVMRAIDKSPTRKKRTVQPCPSPLRFSSTCDTEPGLCGPGAPEDLASLNTAYTDTLGNLEEQLICLMNDADFMREGNSGLLSSDFSHRNVSCMLESLDHDVVSYIDGPFSPEQDKRFDAFSGDDDDEASSLEDYPEIPDEYEMYSEAVISRPVWVGRQVTFAEPPRTLRSATPSPRISPHLDVKFGGATKARWKRLRSSCAALIKQKIPFV